MTNYYFHTVRGAGKSGRRWMTVAAAALLLACGVMARADDAGKTYPIKLAPPVKVGDKFTFSGSGSRITHSVFTVAGHDPVPQDQNVGVQIEAEIEVMKVDAKGGASKLSCTIKKFVHTDGKDPAEILPAGTVAIADANQTGKEAPEEKGKTHFSLKEGDITAEQKEALGMVIDAHVPDSPTDDETFGTPDKQKVGGTWAINSAKVAEDAERSGLKIKAEDVSGQGTLAGVTQVGGSDYLQVKVNFTLNNVTVPLPRQMKGEPAKMKGVFSTLLPMDQTVSPTASTMDMQTELTAKGKTPDGDPLDVKSTSKIHRESELTPVKK